MRTMRHTQIKTALRAVATLLSVLVPLYSAARADSYGHIQSSGEKSENQIEAEKHMVLGEWKEALPFLEARAAGYPAEIETVADLGHVYLKIGDLEQAIEKLKLAVDLDPRHLEANLYLGEAYLASGDLPHAQQNLAALDKICTFGCGEYTTLKKDIADYKAAKGL